MALLEKSLSLSKSRVSLAAAVYETLLEAIIDGRLAKGAELNAVVLASQLQVSRTPVQDAIRRLQADGLVINPLGRKARVAEFSAQDVTEVYAMRGLLESTAAALAADRMSAETLLALRSEMNVLAAAMADVDWVQRALDFDIRFHAVIAEASGNTRLCDDIGRYRLLVRGLCRMTGTLSNLQAAFGEHQVILQALEERDSQAARRAMQRHIDKRLASVIDKFSRQGSVE